MTQAPFDRLVEFADGNTELGDHFSKDEIVGQKGYRQSVWDTDQIEHDWTGKMYALMTLEQAGLAGRILFYDEDRDEDGERRTLIIGEDQGEDTWAILLEMEGGWSADTNGFKPYSTQLEIHEHPDHILDLVHEKEMRQMSDAADTIIAAIKGATGGDHVKMQLLKKCLEQSGGEELLALWQVQEDAAHLSSSTPDTISTRRPGKRL